MANFETCASSDSLFPPVSMMTSSLSSSSSLPTSVPIPMSVATSSSGSSTGLDMGNDASSKHGDLNTASVSTINTSDVTPTSGSKNSRKKPAGGSSSSGTSNNRSGSGNQEKEGMTMDLFQEQVERQLPEIMTKFVQKCLNDVEKFCSDKNPSTRDLQKHLKQKLPALLNRYVSHFLCDLNGGLRNSSMNQRRGKRRTAGGLERPKKPTPRSSYFIFASERRKEIAAAHPGLKATELAKVTGEKWRGLSKEQREVYNQKYKQERAALEQKEKANNGNNNNGSSDDNRRSKKRKSPATSSSSSSNNSTSNSNKGTSSRDKSKSARHYSRSPSRSKSPISDSDSNHNNSNNTDQESRPKEKRHRSQRNHSEADVPTDSEPLRPLA